MIGFGLKISFGWEFRELAPPGGIEVIANSSTFETLFGVLRPLDHGFENKVDYI